MRVVLGIDAAWTEREPSGVALIMDDGSGWRLGQVCASYEEFLLAPDSDPITRHRGSVPNPGQLLRAAESKAGSAPDIVAIDMPLSKTPITSRRVADNMISSIYGSRGGGTHTPSAIRPGKISDDLRAGFDAADYPLAVTMPTGRNLIEVYPHPALIELAVSEQRLPYKHSKIGKYWRHEAPAVRRRMLLEVWGQILDLIEVRIGGTRAALPLPALDSRGYQMKAFEDQLDAVICAWVGACAIDGQATAYGDGDATIWVPSQR